MIDELFLPNGRSLHKVVVGQSGSGKSTFLEKSAASFLRSNDNPTFRMIYFAPKHEGFVDLLPRDRKKRVIGLTHDLDSMLKSVEKNRLTVFYPDPMDLEMILDETINSLFDMKEINPDMKATLIIDDAQVFLSSRKQASDANRRLALLGRSREINAIYVSHALVMNKSLEGQVERLFFFTLPAPIHYKAGIERYGFDPAPYVDDLKMKPFSFIDFDVRTGLARRMNPIPLE